MSEEERRLTERQKQEAKRRKEEAEQQRQAGLLEERHRTFHEQPLRTAWEYYVLPIFLEKKEYRIFHRGQQYSWPVDLAKILSELGDDGWELIGTVPIIASEKPALVQHVLVYTDANYLLFKRPKKAW